MLLTVTKDLIDKLSPYQGNDQILKVGDILTLEQEKVPCVYRQPGRAATFSIYYGQTRKDYASGGRHFKADRPEYWIDCYWTRNRFSLNTKFIPKKAKGKN